MAGEFRHGSRESNGRSSPALFFVLGGLSLGVNHLSVVLGRRIEVIMLVVGCFLVLLGVLAAYPGRRLDFFWEEKTNWRNMGFVILAMVIAIGTAELFAWAVYGQHLTDGF